MDTDNSYKTEFSGEEVLEYLERNCANPDVLGTIKAAGAAHIQDVRSRRPDLDNAVVFPIVTTLLQAPEKDSMELRTGRVLGLGFLDEQGTTQEVVAIFLHVEGDKIVAMSDTNSANTIH